jgi:AbrB family looped-hinge helix DNA binding protein
MKGSNYVMNTVEERDRLTEFSHIPVSSQGQVTLPKAVRERLGVKVGSSNRVNIVIRTDGTIVIEAEPTVDSLFGILKPLKSLEPANAYELREEIINERVRDLGYTPKND